MDKRTLFFVVLTTLAFFGINLFFSLKTPTPVMEEPTPQPVAEQIVDRPPLSRPNENFYVLENNFQQLVFTDVGGALAEINLPFEKDDSESVVREIGFDRTMVEHYPSNAMFPDFEFYTPGTDGPVLNKGRSLGGYSPLLRRPIIDPEGKPVTRVAPQFLAFNVVGKYPELANLKYNVKEFSKNKIVFEASQAGRRITKTFSLPENAADLPYVVDVAIDVAGDRELLRSLWVTTGVPEVEMLGRSPTNVLKYRQTRNGKGEVNKISKPKMGRPTSIGSTHPDWVVNSNGFFGLIVDPVTEVGAGYRAEFVSGTEVPSRLLVIDAEHERFKPARLFGYNVLLPLNPEGGQMKFRLFAGPFDSKVLNTVDATILKETGVNPDYRGAKTFMGTFSFISRPFSKLLFYVINFFHMITRSWVVSIILLTVVVRAVLFPLASWSMKSMRRMQLIQPDVKRIQEKYKKDPRRAQQEVLMLYRKKKVNPFSGCVPLIIQMPFLIGMFDLLKSTYALRGTSFIPGWIDNLAASDVLFSWSMPIFFVGTEFHLLPILLAFVMMVQQRFTSKLPKDKSLWTDQQKQQRTMSNVMVVAFGLMFYNFPAGLCIYWLSSMLLSILQQWYVNRQLDKNPDQPASSVRKKAVRAR
jgi:YidC/Oxa1 family membrane protein insertase